MKMIIGFMAVAWMALSQASWGAQNPFSFHNVVTQAQKLASQDYQAPPEIPNFLKSITYDQWRDIRFKNDYTLWGNDPVSFKIRFFHVGLFYRWPVTIHYVDDSGVHVFPFSPALFDYGKNDFAGKVPPDLGFAGFRIHYPINKPSYPDEIAVFLGATYFRALGRGMVYGASARGLAVNTATDTGEEFPFFKEFWIIKPKGDDRSITVYALLDSPSLAGAYSFVIAPGRETVMKIHSALFFRKAVKKVGLAAMTSMFFYGENSRPGFKDGLRPEVHDSDGVLLFLKTGEWVWRPLINPADLQVNTFEGGTPRGFGLLQRDTDFDHYQDLEARYDLRPSMWVTPGEDWGPGHLELVEIPSDKEQNDNINVYWVPQKEIGPGQTMNFSYTMEWYSAKDKQPALGFVSATRIAPDDNSPKFVIDFEGKDLEAIISDKDISADVRVGKGWRIKEQELFKNTVTGGWRLVFKITLDNTDLLKGMIPGKKPSVGLRAFLKNAKGPLTETWDYVYIP